MRKSMIIALVVVLLIPYKLGEEQPIPQEPKRVTSIVLPAKVIEVKKEKPIEYINIRASYYTNSIADCGKTDGITASGKNLRTLSRGGSVDHITYIAVPKGIPFGTRFYVQGIGVCEAVDIGGAIKWHGDTMWIDVFVPHATARELNKKGIMNTKGYIIK